MSFLTLIDILFWMTKFIFWVCRGENKVSNNFVNKEEENVEVIKVASKSYVINKTVLEYN